MVHYCCVPQCKSKYGVGEFKFHAVPKKMSLRRSWQRAIHSGKPLSDSMKICSRHFKETDYLPTCTGLKAKLNPSCLPSQNLPTLSHSKKKQTNNPRGERLVMRLFKKNKVNTATISTSVNKTYPTVTVGTEEADPKLGDHEDSVPKEIIPEQDEILFHFKDDLELHSETVETCDDLETIETGSNIHDSVENAKESGEEINISVAVQTEDSQALVEHRSTQTSIQLRIGQFISETFLETTERKYLTGLSTEQFDALYYFIYRSSRDFPVCVLGARDQLLLTLIKYKLNLDFVLLSVLFKIDRRIIGNIFRFWTNLMYLEFKQVDIWSLKLSGDGIYTAVIDCTEIHAERSGNPEIHQQMFSSYKNGPTFKGLVAIDEDGKVIFVSELYGGSTTDKEMVQESWFLELLKEGDIILADRGFLVSDILEKKGVALNIPPFRKHGEPQFREGEVMYTRHIAKRRIHIERVIGYGKMYLILQEVMGEHLWPVASQIFYNCMMLCNFKPGIVNFNK